MVMLAPPARAKLEHELVAAFTPDPPTVPSDDTTHSASTPPLNTGTLKSPYAISRPIT